MLQSPKNYNNIETLPDLKYNDVDNIREPGRSNYRCIHSTHMPISDGDAKSCASDGEKSCATDVEKSCAADVCILLERSLACK